jgi:hypothetical protein
MKSTLLIFNYPGSEETAACIFREMSRRWRQHFPPMYQIAQRHTAEKCNLHQIYSLDLQTAQVRRKIPRLSSWKCREYGDSSFLTCTKLHSVTPQKSVIFIKSTPLITKTCHIPPVYKSHIPEDITFHKIYSFVNHPVPRGCEGVFFQTVSKGLFLTFFEIH